MQSIVRLSPSTGCVKLLDKLKAHVTQVDVIEREHNTSCSIAQTSNLRSIGSVIAIVKHSLRQHFARFCATRRPFTTLRVQYGVRCIQHVVWFVHYVVRLYNTVNGVCSTRCALIVRVTHVHVHVHAD